MEITEHKPAHRYRQQIIKDLLRRSQCSGAARILDIVSGQGDLALELRQTFRQAEVAGVELSAEGVAEATRKIPSAQFLQRDLLDPNADPDPLRSWAQYAVCAEVLEHLDDPALFLKHVSRFLAAILRGKRLITDVQSGATGGSGGLARAVMSAFRRLFAMNIWGTSLGWQTVATARWPGEAGL